MGRRNMDKLLVSLGNWLIFPKIPVQSKNASSSIKLNLFIYCICLERSKGLLLFFIWIEGSWAGQGRAICNPRFKKLCSIVYETEKIIEQVLNQLDTVTEWHETGTEELALKR